MGMGRGGCRRCGRKRFRLDGRGSTSQIGLSRYGTNSTVHIPAQHHPPNVAHKFKQRPHPSSSSHLPRRSQAYYRSTLCGLCFQSLDERS